MLACPGHHREPDDSLVVVLNPPTEPSRARSEGGGGLLLRPGAESDKQEPAQLSYWLSRSTQQLTVSMEAKKNLVPLKT